MGQLFSVGPRIVRCNPAFPAYFSTLAEPPSLRLAEHAFEDSLPVDFSGGWPTLDPDGVSYNCKLGEGGRRFFPFSIQKSSPPPVSRGRGKWAGGVAFVSPCLSNLAPFVPVFLMLAPSLPRHRRPFVLG